MIGFSSSLTARVDRRLRSLVFTLLPTSLWFVGVSFDKALISTATGTVGALLLVLINRDILDSWINRSAVTWSSCNWCDCDRRGDSCDWSCCNSDGRPSGVLVVIAMIDFSPPRGRITCQFEMVIILNYKVFIAIHSIQSSF